MLKKLWILLFLYCGLVGCENIFRSMSGFTFSWISSNKPNNSSSDTICVNDNKIITFNQNETEINIESTFPSIKDPEGRYIQSDLISDDYLPNTNENFYFTTGIEFYKWLDPNNYKYLPVFFDNLLEIAKSLNIISLRYLVRFVDGIIRQVLVELFEHNNETGTPDPKQVELLNLTETLLTDKKPQFSHVLTEKLLASTQEEIDKINQTSVVELTNLKIRLQRQKQKLEQEKQKLEQVLTLIQNALEANSKGLSPSGRSTIGLVGVALPNAAHHTPI
jgi:hypothetical protein